MNAPLPVPPTWTTGTTEGIHTGTWRAATPRHIAAPSPCRQACPVGGEIATWIGQARSGDLHGAWLTLVRNNPFPSIAGRICHHPCEAACNRGGYDEALSICRLERHVGDQALAQGWALPAPQPQTQLGAGPETRAAHAARATHVAVVGGGPAGLSAAYQLRRRGHRVSLYEASTELGGVMRHGIPAYRLSRRVLDAEIARIVALGVELHCGQALSGTDALDALARTHDAVFVALGAQQPKALAQIDGAPAWFMDGAGYLAACSRGAPPALGRRVVVVGGGSAAIDVARSARRAGHAVTLLALERRPQMPAQRDEVDEALEEGITLVDGAQLGSVHEAPEGTVDAALTLQCRRVDFVPGAERGRFELRPIDAGDFTLAADAVLAAIGQDARLDDLGPALQRRGALLWTDDAARPAMRGSGPVATWPAWRASSPRRWAWAHAPHGPSTPGCASAPGWPRWVTSAAPSRWCRCRPSACTTTRRARAPPRRDARRPSAWPTRPRCSWGWMPPRRWPRRSAASPAATASTATSASPTAPTWRCSAWMRCWGATASTPTTARAAACACANAPPDRWQ
jgi:NADPH-dependent glutamate synthase beta subunit-like oxidoreductase